MLPNKQPLDALGLAVILSTSMDCCPGVLLIWTDGFRLEVRGGRVPSNGRKGCVSLERGIVVPFSTATAGTLSTPHASVA